MGKLTSFTLLLCAHFLSIPLFAQIQDYQCLQPEILSNITRSGSYQYHDRTYDEDGNLFLFLTTKSNFEVDNSNNIPSIESDQTTLLKFDTENILQWTVQYQPGASGIASTVPTRKVITIGSDVFIMGEYKIDFQIGDFELIADGIANHFMAKIAADGTVVWAKQISSSTSFYSADKVAKVTNDGDILIAGYFNASIRLDNGNVDHTGAQVHQDLYLQKIDPTNGSYIWSKHFESSNISNVHDMLILEDGSIVINGLYDSTPAVFDNVNLDFIQYGTSIAIDDQWVLKLNAQGVTQWGIHNGACHEYFQSKLAYKNNKVYSVGVGNGYSTISKIDSNQGTTNWSKKLYGDFVYHEDHIGIDVDADDRLAFVAPLPKDGSAYVKMDDKVLFEFYDNVFDDVGYFLEFDETGEVVNKKMIHGEGVAGLSAKYNANGNLFINGMYDGQFFTPTDSLTENNGLFFSLNLAPATTSHFQVDVTSGMSYPSGNTFAAVNMNINSDYQHLEWNTGSNETLIENLTNGIYSVTVTDYDHCNDKVNITIGPEPGELNICKIFDNKWTTSAEVTDGSWGITYPTNIEVDQKGYVYTSGPCRDAFSFGGLDIDHWSTHGSTILKTDEQGNGIFAKKITSPSNNWSYEGIHDIEIDPQNNLIVGGYFRDNYIKIDDISIQSTGWASFYYSEAFIYKLNEHGDAIWGKGFGGDDNVNLRALKTDENNNIYVFGSAKGQVAIDGDTLTSAVNYNSVLFFAKFDSNGNKLWLNKLDSENNFGPTDEAKIEITNAGDIYLYVDDSGGAIEINNQIMDAGSQLLKFGVGGNLKWAKELPESFMMEFDTEHRPWLLGRAYGPSVTFDEVTFETETGYFTYLLRYDSQGNAVEGVEIEYISNINTLLIDGDGKFYVTDAYNGNSDQLFVFDQNGAPVTAPQINLSGAFYRTATIGDDGTVYVARGKPWSITKLDNTGDYDEFIDLENKNTICENGTISLTTLSQHDTYNWSTGATEPSIEVSALGDYALTVTDEVGCQDADTVSVTNLVDNNIEIYNINIQNNYCDDPGNGIIFFNTSGAAYPVEFDWSNGEDSHFLDGLAVGTYGVTITDAHGCDQSYNDFMIEETNILNIASTTSINELTCSSADWMHIPNSNDEVILSVKTNGEMPSISARVFVKDDESYFDGAALLKRSFVIFPNNNSTPSGEYQVRFYLTDDEVASLANATTWSSFEWDQVNTIEDLKVINYQGPTEDDIFYPWNNTYLYTYTPTFGSDFNGRYIEATVNGFGEFWFANMEYGDTGLAIEGVTLSGTISNDYAELIWGAPSEFLKDEFMIERSRNDAHDFIAVGAVAVDPSQLAYQYLDRDIAPGIYYYRLRATKDNDEIIYSNTIILEHEVDGDFKLYPNPVSGGDLTILYESQVTKPVMLSVFNVIGKFMFDQEVLMVQGMNVAKINIDQLQTGNYYIRLRNGDKSNAKRFVKVEER